MINDKKVGHVFRMFALFNFQSQGSLRAFQQGYAHYKERYLRSICSWNLMLKHIVNVRSFCFKVEGLIFRNRCQPSRSQRENTPQLYEHSI